MAKKMAQDGERWAELTNRGNVKQEGGDLEGAIADFTRAIALAPAELAPHYNRGNARALAGELEEAVADYSEALRLDPRFAPAYTRRGLARQRLGDLDGAEEDLERALEIAPEDPDAHGTRGSVRALRGDYAGARADCERALELAPPGWRYQADVTELLGELRSAAPEDGEAAHEHDGADEASPPDGRALLAVEQVLAATGWTPERRVGEDDTDGWVDYVSLVEEGVVSAVVARVSETLGRFLLYVVFRPKAPRARRAEVAEFVTRANDGLCDGNFEMSYADGEVRYKIAIDWAGAELAPRLVQNAVIDAMDIGEAYGEALAAVLRGKKTAKQAIRLAEHET